MPSVSLHFCGTADLEAYLRASPSCACTAETAMPLSLSSRSEASLHDHSCGDGLVGAWIDEDEGTSEAVAAVGVVEEGCGGSQ